jgi:hypothetical protein
MSDQATSTPWTDGWRERSEQIGWVLAYEADLDADFLAHYGIDLEEDEMCAPRYFALAQRTFAYSGVMAARAEAQNEDAPTSGTREVPRTRPATAPEPAQVQSVAALAARFPEEIELVRVTADG